MIIHLIRHAHAGSRSAWRGDDTARPLSERGWEQSRVVADALEGLGIDALWSSSYIRCQQTLDPLAQRIGLEVVDQPELTEGAGGRAALDLLLAGAADGLTVAACSHGDVIPAALAAALGRGADLEGPAAPKKGARYELHVSDGAVTRIVHHPAPTPTVPTRTVD